MKIVINAVVAKQHAGGGFQIAQNFLLTALADKASGIDWCYFVSEDLHRVIGDKFADLLNTNYFVFPTQPNSSYLGVRKMLRATEKALRPDLIYSVLAPSYFTFKTTEVYRCANSFVTNPTREAMSKISFNGRLRMWFYVMIQRAFIKRCNYFVTQSSVVAEGLRRLSKTSIENVKVVPNVVPAFFSSITPQRKSAGDGYVHLVYVASTHAHKNIDIIPEILNVLLSKHGISNIKFHLTIPFNSSYIEEVLYPKLSDERLRDNIVNHDYCTQGQLVDLYQSCDICFMPSLLETFSATLLEAMFFNLCIVASDFPFNSEVTKEAAIYFKPCNAEDATQKIVELVNSEKLQEQLKSAIADRLTYYVSYDKHFEAIAMFLKEVIAK